MKRKIKNNNDIIFEMDFKIHTGISDINGVDIYEGDIVALDNKKWEVVYVEKYEGQPYCAFELFLYDETEKKNYGWGEGLTKCLSCYCDFSKIEVVK